MDAVGGGGGGGCGGPIVKPLAAPNGIFAEVNADAIVGV